MSCGLTTGRKEPCLDNVGGIKRVYLFKYVDYTYNQIVGVKGSTLTGFPPTIIYGYECVQASFDEQINNETEGISVDQELVFTLLQQNTETKNELEILLSIDFRYIVEYNNGKFRIGGLFKGANIEEIKAVSGGGKSELTGYQITIKSEEEYPAAFMDNLEIVTGGEDINYIFMDGNNYVFMDGNNFIFN